MRYFFFEKSNKIKKNKRNVVCDLKSVDLQNILTMDLTCPQKPRDLVIIYVDISNS